MEAERQNSPDLDLLSPLVARARAVLVGKSRSYVNDAIDFARALIAAAEEIERLNDANYFARALIAAEEEIERLMRKDIDLLIDFGGSEGVKALVEETRRLQAENARLITENERLVGEYAEALIRANGFTTRTTA